MSLEINQLTGGYAHVPVLKEVSFTVPNNQVVGLIGLNGAGKSTTIKHIIGLLTPQKGTITLDGVTLQSNPDQYRQKVAYVPETPVLYPELTLKEHLELTMMAYDLNVEETWVKANALLKRFRLDNKLDWFPVHFSKGMRQKVMIVNAFMTNADLFIIDEPFTGLDPLAIHDLLEIIAEKKAQGAAILMSTHILATAQQYADSFVLLNQGRVRTTGTLEELKIEFNMADADLDDIYLQMTKEG
ncbi:ABC transporter ATP-binding protein [Latilactobacillus curvatus]|uniref:ABC transporter ATP-binding protein n=2 Tax=Latilactobacillus curvatus TaxID=28038 RepID=A0A1B2A877_LATCU|nr:ABC transporter ATP-binding protein [Latilactobacillus curvatus]ANY14164.1 multidrug ABC transporter ATP-binding protein [Latilactobacillus curvatus]AXN36238.1 ABC transporter ATP-binding protein [Latilactobacillus curvatus]AZP96032.1 ABC transporter ATP-binding protein [Latilactobacillus curvatus]KRK92509.1 ABC-type transporter ATP-binding protein EcsA [Latilactobacillus curvatus JCM 1096 = DSM 20019]MBZ1504834.1 ABC transporter ATP-binding protein [Latilactobacillus curvatus]